MSDTQETTREYLYMNRDENKKPVPLVESVVRSESEHRHVTIGAAVSTGFEQTVADEVKRNSSHLAESSKTRERYILILQWKVWLRFIV